MGPDRLKGGVKKVSYNMGSLCILYTDTLVQSAYIISAPRYEHGKKFGARARFKWEMEEYTQAGIPAHDVKILMQVKRNAKILDANHGIGCLKFGRGSLVGLLRVIGGFTDVLLAYWDIYLPASKVSKGDDTAALKRKMKLRIVALGCIGSVPLVGDLAVTISRWNIRNAAALEMMLLKRTGFSAKPKETPR